LNRGSAPPLDLPRLESELHHFLDGILHGDTLASLAPEGLRRLNDVAFSGDGEPTSASEFPEIVERVGLVLQDLRLRGSIKVVLITNGSLMHRQHVQLGIEAMAELNGEVWFKIDRGTEAERQWVNDTTLSQQRLLSNLRLCAERCRTRIQTCWFAVDGNAPTKNEEDAYIDLLHQVHREGTPIQDVLLYGLARESHQPEASRLTPVSATHLHQLADRIRTTGFAAEVSL
jgi:wyosine [tRNA(Phe)-imidazoG37] synthetase (radical SAM superfamily)